MAVKTKMDKQRQKTDLSMLKYATELVKAGGILSIVHVSKTKAAHEKFTKSVAYLQAKIEKL